MGVTVRPLAPADVPPARAMLAGCGAFTAEEVRVAADMIEAGLAGDYHLLAVASAGAFAGYACIGPAALTERSWYLYWICLAEPGAGLALPLMAGIEAHIQAQGGNRLVAETSGRDAYARARAFYRKAGFDPCGRIPDFYAAGDDCILYVKALTPPDRPPAPRTTPQ